MDIVLGMERKQLSSINKCQIINIENISELNKTSYFTKAETSEFWPLTCSSPLSSDLLLCQSVPFSPLFFHLYLLCGEEFQAIGLHNWPNISI